MATLTHLWRAARSALAFAWALALVVLMLTLGARWDDLGDAGMPGSEEEWE